MNNTNKLSLAIIAGMLLQHNVLAAEKNAPVNLQEIEVSVNRSVQTLDTVTKAVSVIEAETLEQRQSTNILQLMDETPGLSYSPDGMQSGQLVIRGFSTQGFRAPLFINGDRFRGRNTLEYMMLDPNQIERVEIIRGPASSIYGTDSFGGLVNVITKKAEGDVTGPFQFTNSYLNSEYQSVNKGLSNRLQVAGSGNGFDMLLGASFRKGKDYKSPAGKIPNSDYDAKSYDARVGYTLSKGHRVELIAKNAEIERGRAGGQFGAPGAGNAAGEVQRQMRELPMKENYFSVGYQGGIEKWGVDTLETTLYRRNLKTHINVVPNLNKPAKFVDVYIKGPVVTGGKLVATKPSLQDRLLSTYGFDWYDEVRNSSEKSVKGGDKKKTTPKADQFNLGVFMLHEYDVSDRLLLSGSLRHDYLKTGLDTDFISDSVTKSLFDDVGDTTNQKTTGGIGLIFEATKNLDLVANINTSFRAPSLVEVSSVGSGVSKDFRIPNKNLKPEEGITYELGLRWNNERLSGNVVGFMSKYDNFIDRNVPVTFNGNTAKQVQNIGKAEISGLEMDLAWKATNALTLKTNISWIEGEDTIKNKPLPQIMPLSGFLSAKYQPESAYNYYVEATAKWAKGRKKSSIDEKIERPRSGYVVPNLYAGLDLGKTAGFKKVSLNFGVENIFDKKYSMPTVPESIKHPISKTNPLNQPGRNFQLGFTAHF